MKRNYEDGDTVSYSYDNSGALATVQDSGTGVTTTYYYDFLQRLTQYTEVSDSQTNTVKYTYDGSGNLKSAASIINGGMRTVAYAYDQDNRITLVANAAARENYTYDSLGRTATHVTSHNGSTILTDTFTYRSPTSSTTSGQIATLNTVSPAGYNKTYTYTYDGNGNILTINDGSVTFSYEYDSANQLIRENHPYANATWVWDYDDGGNILSKTKYAFSTGALGEPLSVINYEYTGDLLTKYNGREITYDEIGNPLDDGEWTYTWEHGRQLASMSNGSTTWEFTYNSDGLRTGRTNGTTTYIYIYKGDKLSRMAKNNITLNFIHDKNGSPMVLVYNGVNYYYVTNGQGDVMSIVDSSGNVVVTYFYDAFGQTRAIQGSMASTIGVVNPYRYRGYVWDTELGMFYLESRYYAPDMGRFINADDVDLLGANGDFASLNLFAYCGNNPVSRADAGGYFWDIVFDVASLVVSIVEVVQNPTDMGAWVGLALDAVDVIVPVVGGLGEAADAINCTRKIANATSDANKGWTVGEDITKLTKAGNDPSWSTVRQRYWKNEAYYNADKYSAPNLDRMKTGRAPQVELNGRMYSMELHHRVPRRDGGSNAYSNLLQVTPWEHAEIDQFRHFNP